MQRHSKTLKRLERSDPRVYEYHFFEGDDAPHWLHLNWPWEVDECGSVTGRTVRECREELERAVKTAEETWAKPAGAKS